MFWDDNKKQDGFDGIMLKCGFIIFSLTALTAAYIFAKQRNEMLGSYCFMRQVIHSNNSKIGIVVTIRYRGWKIISELQIMQIAAPIINIILGFYIEIQGRLILKKLLFSFRTHNIITSGYVQSQV